MDNRPGPAYGGFCTSTTQSQEEDVSNDHPPPGEFAPERLEELAQEAAVKIAAIRCSDTTDILFFVAISGSFAGAAKELSGGVTEQGVRKRFTRIFNNLELPFSGNHAEQNPQAMWIVQRAFQIFEREEERRKKETQQAQATIPLPGPTTPVVAAETVAESLPPPTQPEPELSEPEPDTPPETEHEETAPTLAEAETTVEEVAEPEAPEPAPEPTLIETVEEPTSPPESAPAATLHEVEDSEMERVVALICAMPLDTDLRILAGYTFGGTHKEIGLLLGLTESQVTRRIQRLRSGFAVPQLSDHGMFGAKEFDFLARAFSRAYPNGLGELATCETEAA